MGQCVTVDQIRHVGVLTFQLLPCLAVGFLPPTNRDHKAHLVSEVYAAISGHGSPAWESRKEFHHILASSLSCEPGRTQIQEDRTAFFIDGIHTKVLLRFHLGVPANSSVYLL